MGKKTKGRPMGDVFVVFNNCDTYYRHTPDGTNPEGHVARVTEGVFAELEHPEFRHMIYGDLVKLAAARLEKQVMKGTATINPDGTASFNVGEANAPR